MELKAFKKGEKAYMLDRHYGEEQIKEVYVVSVGRKYVNVSNTPETDWNKTTFKQTDCNCTGKNVLPYLEESDWNRNNRNLLFKDETGIQEFRERQELEKWFSVFRRDFNAENKLTTEQLRKIREIVDGNN